MFVVFVFLVAKVINNSVICKKNGLQKCAPPVLRTFAKDLHFSIECYLIIENYFVTLQLWKKRDKKF